MNCRFAFVCVSGVLLCGPAHAQVDWHVTGNTIVPGNWLGTQNNALLEMKVWGVTGFRVVPALAQTETPNIIGGHASNFVDSRAQGAFIGGGGNSGAITPFLPPNIIYDSFCTLGAGAGNVAGTNNATFFDAAFATIGGGWFNGSTNEGATVGGGADNAATGRFTTVAGGLSNIASGLYGTVGGGCDNVASGDYSATLGGCGNEATGDDSMAVGRNARANGNGTFVWADSTTPSSGFVGNGNNQFLVRVTGGFGVNTNAPVAAMHVNGMSNSSVAFYADNAYTAIQGISTANNGNGVHGTCNTGPDAWAVTGESTQGQGVVGRAGPPPLPGGGFPPATGAVGYTTSVTGIGVYGEAVSPTGVNYGVYGKAASPTGWAGYFDGNVFSTGAYLGSSRELKENIRPLTGALSTIMKLQGVSYVWSSSASEGIRGKSDIGFIADEMEQVLPEIVAKDETGEPTGIDYAKITSVAVEAIKALKVENDELKARLAIVEAALAAHAGVAK